MYYALKPVSIELSKIKSYWHLIKRAGNYLDLSWLELAAFCKKYLWINYLQIDGKKKWVIYLMNIVQLAIEVTKSWGKNIGEWFIWKSSWNLTGENGQTVCHCYSNVSRSEVHHGASSHGPKKGMKYEFKSSNLHLPSPYSPISERRIDSTFAAIYSYLLWRHSGNYLAW